jgi:hypothetical protein
VFQFGVGASYCSSDPTRDLKHALSKAPKGNPRPALTDPEDVGDLDKTWGQSHAFFGSTIESGLVRVARYNL